MKIGIMGARGSFSEEAAQKYLREEYAETEIHYLVSAERVLKALEDGVIDIAIFPIENSNGGIVIEAVHAMASHRFKVRKIFEIDVHQNLLAMPGTNPEQITQIASHDQALKQCRMYLKRRWTGVELMEYEDTAKAAEDLAAGILPVSTAVIASKNAARIYGLDVIDESIQDLKFNYTSFIAAERLV